MRRMALAVGLLLCAGVSTARADTLPLFEGIPGTYTPGTSFTFDVRVPQLADFNSYSVEILFTTDVTNPPLIAFPTVASPAPTGRYVFPNSNNFQFTFAGNLDTEYVSLLFSDSTSPGVFAQPGQNDTLVRVTVLPDASLTGPITISLGAGSAFAYNKEGVNFTAPTPQVVEQAGGGGTTPVPAPPSVVLLGIGAVLLAARSRLRR